MAGLDIDHRMSDGTEIVDQGYSVDAEALAKLRRPDDPGIVGELQHLAHHRTGHGDGGGTRQGLPCPLAECFPGSLQARMRVGAERHGIAEARHAAVLDVGDGEPRMRPSDIDRYEFH
jgi:hypothetical protein